MVSAYSNANSGTTDFPTIGGGELGGRTLTPGNYSWTGAVTISTTDVTLDGQGNADAVWIFKTTSALTTDAGRTIILRGGAQPNNIFWVVAGYTNIGVNSVFNGNILGGEYITIQNSATLNGRALSQTAVTLEKNTVTLPVTRSAPLADFTFTNATGTEPLTVVFTDTSSADITGSIISWAWDFNDDGTIESTQRNPVYLYDTAGIYTPNLTVTDSFGAVATKFDTVTVYQPPVADFTFTPAGGPAYLTVAFTDTSHADPALTISSWAWDFDNDGNADNTTRNPEYTYYAEGDHPVNLTVTDNLGAIGTKFDTVTVDPPVLGITITNAPITLALNPDMTTTSTAIQFYVNSTTNWEVTALDADPDTSGFMTSYSGTTYTPANHLIEPFMVLNRGDVYVPLPFGIQVPLSLKIGSPEQSDTAYTLGVQQAVKMADPHLSVNDYRIVVTLTITSL
jgi:PKD repeat protein